MTLQNGLIHKGRAYLWTDTLAVDADGNRFTAMKAMVGLAWPWAAIHSGLFRTDDPNRLAGNIGNQRPKNAAELIDACREGLRTELAEGRPGRLLVAYSCRKAGMGMFLMGNDPAILQAPPFEVCDTVQHACSAADDHWTAEFAARDFTPQDMRGFIGEQLKRPIETPFGSLGEYGGELIEVRVTPKGVRAKQLYEIAPAAA